MELKYTIQYVENGIEKKDIGSLPFSGEIHLVKDLGNITIKSIVGEVALSLEKDDRFFLNGYQTWTHSPERGIDGRERGLHRIPKLLCNHYNFAGYGDYSFVDYPFKKGMMHGFSFMSIRRKEEYTFVGSLDEKPGWTIFFLDTKTSTLHIQRDVENLETKGEYHYFDLFVGKGIEEELYERWFSLMGLKSKAKPLAGYSSWYNRYQDISEKTILDDLEGCKRILKDGDLFQIDDGWEKAVGEWSEDRSKFPSPLKSMVESIHSSGFKAGLWLAPFVAEETSFIFKEHKDWLLRNEDGEAFKCGCNWSGFWALDIDNKEFQEYLKETFHSVFDEWGFDLVKLDFLYGAAPFAKKNETRSGRMIRATEMLRTLCKDKLILGCGIPVMAGFGLTDYSRVSCDVTLDWDDKFWMKLIHSERPSTKRAIETSFSRRMLNKGAFVTDPDVFFLRHDNINLSQERKRILAESCALNQGLFLTSDNPLLYTEEERAGYRRVRHIWEGAMDIHVEHGDKTVIHYTLDGEEKSLELFF